MNLNWASVIVTFIDLSELLHLTTWTPKDQPPRIYLLLLPQNDDL